MKYKEIFKSWWFYSLIVIYFLFSVVTNFRTYGNLFIAEYLGIFLGSFIGILFFVSLFWLLGRGFGKIIPKKK